jgi:hypothetical protein
LLKASKELRAIDFGLLNGRHSFYFESNLEHFQIMSGGYNPPIIDDEKAIHATIVNDQGMVTGPVNAVMYTQGGANPIYSSPQVSYSDVSITAQCGFNDASLNLPMHVLDSSK